MTPQDWNPYQTTMWSRKQVRAWLSTAIGDGWKFYDGARWYLRSKHVGAGVYSVRFENADKGGAA